MKNLKNISKILSYSMVCLVLSVGFISCEKKVNNVEEETSVIEEKVTKQENEVDKEEEKIVNFNKESKNESDKKNHKEKSINQGDEKENRIEEVSDKERYKREIEKNYDRVMYEYNYSYDDIDIELFASEKQGKLDTYLRVFDKQGKLKWEKMWGDKHITELSPISGIKAIEDRLYMVVHGTMYAFVRNSGEELWRVDGIGGSNCTPEIDDEGNIYTTGYYGPFLISISKEGKIRWKKDYANIWWPYDLKVSDNRISVEYDGAIFSPVGKTVFDNEGNEITTVGYLNRDFITAKSSSFLPPQGKNTYEAINVVYGMDKAWVEGVEGHGEGEWIQVGYYKKSKFKAFKIIIENGYKKSKEAYYANNRVKKIRIETDDGKHTWEKTLHDNFEESNIITLENASYCKSLKLTILSVYEGNKYDDTCITDIIINGLAVWE